MRLTGKFFLILSSNKLLKMHGKWNAPKLLQSYLVDYTNYHRFNHPDLFLNLDTQSYPKIAILSLALSKNIFLNMLFNYR